MFIANMFTPTSREHGVTFASDGIEKKLSIRMSKGASRFDVSNSF